MALIVKKFGGTSVGDIDRIKHVANLVKSHKEKTGDRVVLVVSAMAGETNRLIELAKSCSQKPAARELDALVATGEQVSSALVSMALSDIGLKAKSMNAVQARISTDDKFSKAQIQEIDSGAIFKMLDDDIVPVITGFQGIDRQGDMTTLGRGGSDISAVAVAVAVKADSCFIYTDVKGVYSTDPRICRDAKLLDRVCHEEMLELASLGAKVLHPRSVYFAMAYQMPLVVLSTFEPGNGTWIVKEEELVEKPIVTGVTYRTDEAKITLSKLPAEGQAMGRLFSALATEQIFVDMITQTGFDQKTTDISFTVPDEDSNSALEVARRLVSELGAQGASCDRDIAKVSIVGIGMKYHTGVAARLFTALAEENITAQMISTSEIKISVVVPRKYCEVAVRRIHDEFNEHQVKVGEES